MIRRNRFAAFSDCTAIRGAARIGYHGKLTRRQQDLQVEEKGNQSPRRQNSLLGTYDHASRRPRRRLRHLPGAALLTRALPIRIRDVAVAGGGDQGAVVAFPAYFVVGER